MNGYISLLSTLQDAHWRLLPPKRETYHLTTPHWLESEKNNEKAKASAAKAGTAPQKGASIPHKKGKGGGSGGPAPKKARTAKYCKHCKAVDGPYQTHNTSDCYRFDKDGKEVGKPQKPFNPAKKPWKKGCGDSGQMAYPIEKLEKLKKKLKNPNRRSLPRSVRMTCQATAWTANRIMGTVARVHT